jgi:DNA topoisomerase-1
MVAAGCGYRFANPSSRECDVPRLRRSDSSRPGLRRQRRGRGFAYLDPAGRPLKDPETLDRIRRLAIPPAWSDVWICPDPQGHLQALGTDSAGRRQYLYHPRWRERRDHAKFEHMLEFGMALPRIRRATGRDLRLSGLPRARVLACAVRLLDLGFFRIGSEDYAEQNETYGLATMLRRHVSVNGRVVTFDYPGKNGKRRLQSVADPHVRSVVAALKDRRGGRELLAYRQDGGWRDVRSTDINDYIKEVARSNFTAKDFRTWNATLLCSVALATASHGSAGSGSLARTASAAVKQVAEYLGNTPAVCRNSYIDPRVFDRFRAGVTIRDVLRAIPDRSVDDVAVLHGRVERAVQEMLDDRQDGSGRPEGCC